MHEQQRLLWGVADETTVQRLEPEDAGARLGAVDTSRSVLVQAPAGAGKTELLTERFLKLLAEVEEPEDILAITFTRAATAEMRARVVGALQAAAAGKTESAAARAALAHARALGWRLLEQPHRLDVQTIDSLCLRLAHAQPLLARLGGQLQPAENAGALYVRAARRTLALLGSEDEALQQALQLLLLRRDNNLAEVERLLADMLGERGAWLGVLPLGAAESVEWERVRGLLEAPFQAEHRRVLSSLRDAFARAPEQAEELLALAQYAGNNLPEPHLLHTLEELPEDLMRWNALASLLLTKGNDWRKAWYESDGFPPKASSPDAEQWKRRMKDCCSAFATGEHGSRLREMLCALRGLPPQTYTDDQWATLQAVFRVLRRAAAELRVVFAEAAQVDFTEIAQAADAVLRDEGSLRGMLESERKRHLLIDEFQDTSRAQYRLVAELVREWSEGDGRTVFLVGDPLQSIYLFRQAEVALFHETRERGLPCGDGRRHLCHALALTHNFRSHGALVEALNTRLAPMFAEAQEDTFVAAQAYPQAQAGASLSVHAEFVADEGTDDADTLTASPGEREAEEVVRVLAEEIPHAAAAEARGDKEYRIAVLVRSRAQLTAILPAMRRAGIPYRAVDLEPLAEQPEIVDLLALLHALLHPADRVAWLAILRAPWCGLLLGDLHVLAGADDAALMKQPLPELMEERLPLLSPDGRERGERVWRAMEAARATRYTGGNASSLAAWLERTWMELGGHLCLDQTARENVDMFLRLLDEISPSGTELLRRDFAARMAKLFAAPDARTSERFGVQVMTIHKAKGLGFEVVVLPGLARTSRATPTELLAMMQRTRRAPEQPSEMVDELLLAPVSDREGTRDPLYTWVSQQKRRREQEELRRLFYVACTRARKRLHLFATLHVKDGTMCRPQKGSLAEAAWAGLEADFAEELAQYSDGPKIGLAAAAARDEQRPVYTLQRLAAGWRHESIVPDVSWRSRPHEAAPRALYERTQVGSSTRRARGTAIHAVLERLAARGTRQDAGDAELRPAELELVAARSLASSGLPASPALAAEITRYAISAADSEIGRWVLARHPEAAVESAWQHWDASGVLRTVRVDRSFLAGRTPGTWGEECLWVLDYKTGAAPADFADAAAREAWLATQKSVYRGQLETYGAILHDARGDEKPICYALFFAELQELVWWSGD